MTTNTAVPLAGPYSANGVNTSWQFTFKALAAADLALYVDDGAGTITRLTSSVFSVTGLGQDGGGTVTYPLSGAPLAAPKRVTIAREMTYDQSTVVKNQGGFFPKVHETVFDKLTMLIQQVLAFSTASMRAPSSDGQTNLVLPGKLARANRLLGFDANGAPTVSGTSSSVDDLISAAGAAAGSATAAAGSATLAQAWANNPVGAAVSAGLYSAYHWATQAAGSAAAAATSAGNAAAALTAAFLTDGSRALTGALKFTKAAAPAAPPAGTIALYAKTDGKLYRQDETGLEQQAGGGPSYGTNSILRANAQAIAEDIVVQGTDNVATFGPITINTGKTVTINAGGTWVVL